MFGVKQLEANGTDDFFLPVTQDTMYRWTDVTDPAVGIADGENVLAIFDHEPEAFVNFRNRLLRAPETSDFPQDAAHQRAVLNIHGTQTHFKKDFRSVLAQTS